MKRCLILEHKSPIVNLFFIKYQILVIRTLAKNDTIKIPIMRPHRSIQKVQNYLRSLNHHIPNVIGSIIFFQRMGIDIQTYRSRIGSFHQSHHIRYTFDSHTVKLLGFEGIIKMMLLIIGGIETNPGPSGDKPDDAENKVLLLNEEQHKGQRENQVQLENQDQRGIQVKWNEEMLKYLQECRDKAQIRKQELQNTGRKASYMNIMHELWSKRYAQYNLSSKNLQTKLYSVENAKMVTHKRKKKPGRPKITTAHNVNTENEGHPTVVTEENGFLATKGRPKGTTKKDGYGVREGHPKGTTHTYASTSSDGSLRNETGFGEKATLQENEFGLTKGLPKGTTQANGFAVSQGRPKGTTQEDGYAVSSRRPKGTTQKNGFSVSDGRPKGTTKQNGCKTNDPQKTLFKKMSGTSESISIIQNLPTNMAKLFSSRILSERHSSKPLISEICYNCGSWVYGRISEGHKYSTVTKTYPVDGKYLDAPKLPYTAKSGLITSCHICKDGPKDLYPCGDSDGKVYIPKVLKVLNAYERAQLSLCGIFSHILRKVNPMKKSWEIRRGETNVLTKLDKHYKGMYGYLVGQKKEEESVMTMAKVAAGLSWLRQNNPLYASFLSRVETLFRYDKSKSSLPDGSGVQDAKGRSMQQHLQKEPSGLLLPLEAGSETVPQLSPAEDDAGFQHPKMDDQGKTIMPNNLSYMDKDLEAKAWPCLFPYGNGSWFSGGGLTPAEYCKMRLLNYDSRWRDDHDWAFFWVDRMIKSRIFYYNRAKRLRKSDDLTKERYEDLKQHDPYNIYGTDMPTTIPGTKGYWSSKLLDLLAMSSELKKPDYFITVTQNDNWPELQTTIKNGPGSCTPLININDMPFDSGTALCMKHSVETCIAFHERFRLFKENVLEKENGILGKVINYWYRFEYQCRGAIHAHIVVWVDPDTIQDEAVTAEMPRGDNTDPFVKASRLLVQKY